MAVNDELGITHPSLGDNPDLAYIIDQVIEQLKPMLVPYFTNAAARAIAYPTLSDAPPVSNVAGELQVWNPGTSDFFPIPGSRNGVNTVASNGVISAGAGGQIGATFTGPAGFYLVMGSAAASCVDPTKAQVASAEVRFDGTSAGTLPVGLPLGSEIQTVTRMAVFPAAASGSHTAQMVVTGPSFDINLYNGTNVLWVYLGSRY